jgi:hypothetical protein
MEYAIISGIEYKKAGLDRNVLNDNVGTFTDLKTRSFGHSFLYAKRNVVVS